jgi:aldehyde:ferredoxin oxidoreductase
MNLYEHGWTGKILRVDLTERKWNVESTSKYADRFIGGIGIGLKILWDEVGPEIDSFNPGNKLVLAPGPLTGTLAPGSGRFEIVSKSPRSYPADTVTRSGMGGFWGPELKYAGYDALIIQGRADNWINLWIHNGEVKFLEATEYVGNDTYTTQKKLRKELDPEAKILCIGPAGENLSRLAVILSETSFVSGKSGFGAVMGSKLLKAIAVRGTKPLRISNPERMIEISETARQLSANNPMREWTSTLMLDSEDRQSFLNKYRKKNVGCFGCHTLCFAYLSVPDAGESQCHCIGYYYYAAATKYYGHTLERDQAVFDSIVLANKLGLDHYEFYSMIRFLEDLYHSGNIQSQADLPLDQFGSREFIQKFLENIAFRKGIGDLLAEGSARVADQINNGWRYCAKYFPAYGSAEHESPRNNPGIALLWALDSRDPVIDQHPYARISSTFQNRPFPYRLSPEVARMIAKKIYGSEKAIDLTTFDKKPEAIIYTQNRSAVINMLVVCDWVYPIVISYASGEYGGGDTSLESQLLTATTGHEVTENELNLSGERVWNLSRAIMLREGRTRENDTLRKNYFRNYEGEIAIPKADFEKAKTNYYRLRGWDETKGWPTSQKLNQLGLSDVADILQKEKLIN